MTMSDAPGPVRIVADDAYPSGCRVVEQGDRGRDICIDYTG